MAAATVCGTVLIPNQAESKYNTAVYIKGDSMYTLSVSEKDAEPRAMQVLSDDEERALHDMAYQSYIAGTQELSTTLSKDGGKLFYFNSAYSIDDELCYLDLKDENAAPVRISNDALAYSVNESTTLVTFVNWIGGSDYCGLYQYDMQSGTTKKIASGLVKKTDYVASGDGSKIVCSTCNGLYLYSSLGQTEKLSNDYCSQVYTPDDALSTIYYVDEDDTLFCNKTGKAGDSFKIADDVSGVSVSGNGVYYTTDSRNVSMYDYIDKSLLAVVLSDLENPDTGEIDLSEYTFEELEELREQYRTDTTAYERINEIIYLKDELAQEQHLMTLHYFDGSQSSVVAEDVIHGSVDLATNRAIDQSHTAAVLAYAACPDPEKAAALTADDLEAIIESSDSSGLKDIYKEICHFSVAVNGTACALDLNIRSIHLTEDGQTVYIATKNPDNSDIDLYQAGISGNSLQTPTQIASDIDDLQIIGNNAVFWKDSAVFVNGVRIDDDVHSHVAFRDDGSFVYLVGEEDDNSYQLKSYKDGEITTIADDVFDFGFTTGGDLLYLRDYNLNRCVGTLYLYNGKDSTKLDDDVAAIISGKVTAYDCGSEIRFKYPA